MKKTLRNGVKIAVITTTAVIALSGCSPQKTPETEAGTEAVIGEADETTGVEVAEESSEAADDKIEITTDDILAGDIVALEVNADGEVTSLTILAYGTGSYVDTTEAETDLAEEALLGDEASTEAVTE